MSDTGRSAAGLWQDFLFLTQEMLKFLSKRDMDMFYQLLEQRGKLQILLDAADDKAFQQSTAGQELFKQLRPLDQTVNERLRLLYNQSRRQLAVDQSYDQVVRSGRRINYEG